MFDLTGRNALVTGASGGIGGAVAQALHAAGATVTLSGTREAPLRELAEKLGSRAHVLTANLGDAAAVCVHAQHTNMVFIEVAAARLPALAAHLEAHGIRASIGYLPQVRLVTHLDIDDAGIDRTAEAFARFFATR